MGQRRLRCFRYRWSLTIGERCCFALHRRGYWLATKEHRNCRPLRPHRHQVASVVDGLPLFVFEYATCLAAWYQSFVLSTSILNSADLGGCSNSSPSSAEFCLWQPPPLRLSFSVCIFREQHGLILILFRDSIVSRRRRYRPGRQISAIGWRKLCHFF